MAALCVPTPFQTEFQTQTIVSRSNIFSDNVITIPPVFTTVSSSACLYSSLLPALCLEPTNIFSVSLVQEAQLNTVQVPATIDVQITQIVPTTTLFQPCSSTSSSATSSPSSSSSLSSSSSPSQPPASQQPFVTSSILVLSTPSPSTSILSSSTTLANGQISITYQTIIYTPSPTSVYVPTTVLAQASGGGSTVNLGAIIGGCVGGLIGLLLIIVLLWWIRRRRMQQNNYDDLIEETLSKDDLREHALQRSRNRPQFDVDCEPKPYEYGVLGSKSQQTSVLDHFSSTTGLLHVASPLPPTVEFSTTNSPPETCHESSRPPSRRNSVSSRFSTYHPNSEFMASPSTQSTAHSGSGGGCGSEDMLCTPSLSHRVSTQFGDWLREEVVPSSVSFKWLGNLRVVNQHENSS